jgi:ABC-type bacteriocin/lantibiotic exporter with double-glycine peptidase domain
VRAKDSDSRLPARFTKQGALLCFDESTSALDEETEAAILS